MNVTIEDEGNIESNISDMAVTIFKPSNKEIRNIIIKSKNTPICSIGFWKRKFGIDVERYFGNAIRACKETRLRLLHFKILHNIYPTTCNILLRKMKIKNTDIALFGILATEHHNLRDRTINDINMILLVAKMCISKVKYGKERSLAMVFEVEMASREKLINQSEKEKKELEPLTQNKRI